MEHDYSIISAAEESLSEELQKAFYVFRVVEDIIGEVHLEVSARAILSGALYHLSLEHSESILLLVREGNSGSALALLRPAHEALLRAVWIAHAASDESIERLARLEDISQDKKTMSAAIERCAPEELRAAVTQIHQAFPNGFWHDLTHGGVFQISQRFIDGAIGRNFTEEILIILVQAASFLLSACAMGVAALTKREELYRNIVDRVTEQLKEPLNHAFTFSR